MTSHGLQTKITPPNSNPTLNPNPNPNPKYSGRLPSNDDSLWTPTHPHRRPRGPGTGPGSTTKGPGTYCAHCHKNGWIITNPLHLADCQDATRAAAESPPQAQFNGIDISVLQAVATGLGVLEPSESS
jgi:hypothetical protein